jgi:hypothetical protein
VARTGDRASPSATISAPIAAAISSGAAQLAQLIAGNVAVIEGDLAAVLELLALLVALAGDDDGVTAAGLAERQRYRSPPVGLDLDRTVLNPSHDLADDRLRVFGARVV